MREKKFIRTLTYLCVAILACGTAFAQKGKLTSGAFKGTTVPMTASDAPDAVFYNNFVVDPCTGCNYSADNGYLVLGPSNCGIPGSTQWLAYPFVSNLTGNTRQVTLSVTNWGICTPTSNKFTVDIYSDNCANIPGASLGTAIANAAAAPCGTSRARLQVPLVAGQKVLAGSYDLSRAEPNGDDRGMVADQYCLVGLQLGRWERLGRFPSRLPGRLLDPVISDTDRILNRARADTLRELVLFCGHHGPPKRRNL